MLMNEKNVIINLANLALSQSVPMEDGPEIDFEDRSFEDFASEFEGELMDDSEQAQDDEEWDEWVNDADDANAWECGDEDDDEDFNAWDN